MSSTSSASNSGQVTEGGFDYQCTLRDDTTYTFVKEVNCAEAVPGQILTHPEKKALREVMRKCSDLYPYTVVQNYRNCSSSLKVKKTKIEVDRIAKLKCEDKNCPVKYLVLRRNKWIAAYVITNKEIEAPVALQHQNHASPDSLTKGLCMETKRLVNGRWKHKATDIYKDIMMKSENEKQIYYATGSDPNKFQKQIFSYHRKVQSDTKWCDETQMGNDELSWN
jgi:hypothetical protein